jgi:GDP-L-fucose synthase
MGAILAGMMQGRLKRLVVTYAGDVAQGMLTAAQTYQKNEIVNISSGVETSIRQLTERLQALTAYKGEITWNTSRPDGQLRRCFDLTKARNDLGFEAKTDLAAGLRKTLAWYQNNLHNPKVRS